MPRADAQGAPAGSRSREGLLSYPLPLSWYAAGQNHRRRAWEKERSRLTDRLEPTLAGTRELLEGGRDIAIEVEQWPGETS